MSTERSSTFESIGARASRPLSIAGGALFGYGLFELVRTGVAEASLFAGALVLAVGLVFLRW